MSTVAALLHDLSLFELACDQPAQAAALLRLADLALDQGHGARVIHICRLALERTGHPSERAEVYGKVATVLLARPGHALAAHRAYAESARSFAASGESERAWAAELAGEIARSLVDTAAARSGLLALSRAISRTPGRRKLPWLRRVRVTLAELDLRDGRLDHAELSLANARSLLLLEGASGDGVLDGLEGRIALARGRLDDAERLLGRAEEWFVAHLPDDGFARLRALEARGFLLLERAEEQAAHRLLGDAIAMADRLGDRLRAARLEMLRASAFVDGNPSEATRFILRAADRLLSSGAPAPELARSLVELAEMIRGSSLAADLRRKLLPSS